MARAPMGGPFQRLYVLCVENDALKDNTWNGRQHFRRIFPVSTLKVLLEQIYLLLICGK